MLENLFDLENLPERFFLERAKLKLKAEAS